jgi:hypothetical protein
MEADLRLEGCCPSTRKIYLHSSDDPTMAASVPSINPTNAPTHPEVTGSPSLRFAAWSSGSPPASWGNQARVHELTFDPFSSASTSDGRPSCDFATARQNPTCADDRRDAGRLCRCSGHAQAGPRPWAWSHRKQAHGGQA